LKCDDDDEGLPEDTLENVKKKRRGQPDRQYVILNDQELADDRTLKYYDIQAGSTLHLGRLLRGRIHVKTQTGKMITLEVVPEDTIENVKKKIFEERGIAVKCTCIVYAGKVLENQRATLRDYNIRRESILYLIPTPRGSVMPIHLRTSTGKTIALQVAPQETISNVKEKISKKKEVTVESQSLCLFYAGEELNDSKTLKDYNIRESSVLQLKVKKSSEARLPLLFNCEVTSQMAARSSTELSTTSRKRRVEESWGSTAGQDVLNLAVYKHLQTTKAFNPEDKGSFLYYLKHERKVAILDIQPGSLIITVECSSLQKLEELWDDFCTSYVSKVVKKCLLTKGMLSELGLSKVKFSTSIPKEKYETCHRLLKAFESNLKEKCFDIKTLRDEFQNRFRDWVSTRKHARRLLKDLETAGLNPQKVVEVSLAINKDKHACQSLTVQHKRLEKSVANFAVFCRDHIHLVLSSELAEGEFHFLLYILRGTYSPGAAANAQVPLHVLVNKEVNIHDTHVSTLMERFNWRSLSAYQGLSSITQQILHELQEGPNDDEIQTMITNFIEAKFAEACES